MDGRPTWTDCDEAGDYVVPNVLSPRDLVFRPDNIDEKLYHTHGCKGVFITRTCYHDVIKDIRFLFTHIVFVTSFPHINTTFKKSVYNHSLFFLVYLQYVIM